MAGTHISLGGGGDGSGGGSIYYGDPVANFAALPGTAQVGEHRLTLDTGSTYWWDGASWQLTRSGVNQTQHSDTDSIDMTVTNGVVSSDLKISADAATASFLKATTTIKSGANAGLHVELPYADTDTIGVLTDTDWDTFNNKEPAIAAGTVDQYYRGDKSFVTHDIASIVATTDGSAPAVGKINESLSATQATNTATGIGATGTWGAATSVSLTAGRWIVRGVAGLSEQTANLSDSLQCGISDSATGAGISEFNTTVMPCLISGSSDMLIPTPAVFVNISSTTTYYLNTKFTYDAGTPQHRGKIEAIRIG